MPLRPRGRGAVPGVGDPRRSAGHGQGLSFGSGRISERGLVPCVARRRREPMRSIGDRRQRGKVRHQGTRARHDPNDRPWPQRVRCRAGQLVDRARDQFRRGRRRRGRRCARPPGDPSPSTACFSPRQVVRIERKSSSQRGRPISVRCSVRAIARRRKALVAELPGLFGNAAGVRAGRRPPGNPLCEELTPGPRPRAGPATSSRGIRRPGAPQSPRIVRHDPRLIPHRRLRRHERSGRTVRTHCLLPN